MRFGEKKSFAVEFELDESYGGPWLYGKFCYWVNGVQVGDYVLGTSLRDVLFAMKWVVYDCGNRYGGNLCKIPAQEVFFLLDGALYGNEETNSDLQLPDQPARFEVKIQVDIFDQWKVYLIECDDKATILFKNINDSDVKVATIPTKVFDDAIKGCFDSLTTLYNRENAGSDGSSKRSV